MNHSCLLSNLTMIYMHKLSSIKCIIHLFNMIEKDCYSLYVQYITRSMHCWIYQKCQKFYKLHRIKSTRVVNSLNKNLNYILDLFIMITWLTIQVIQSLWLCMYQKNDSVCIWKVLNAYMTTYADRCVLIICILCICM